MAVVGLNAIDQMFFLSAYPFWSLMIIAVDVVALYGLCTYGSRQNLGAPQATVKADRSCAGFGPGRPKAPGPKHATGVHNRCTARP